MLLVSVWTGDGVPLKMKYRVRVYHKGKDLGYATAGSGGSGVSHQDADYILGGNFRFKSKEAAERHAKHYKGNGFTAKVEPLKRKETTFRSFRNYGVAGFGMDW